MWVASLLSVVFSHLALFSLGPVTFLITCLQLGATADLKRSENQPRRTNSLLVAVLVWIVIVPAQILVMIIFERGFIGWFYAFPLTWVIASVLIFLQVRPKHSGP